MPAVTVGVQEFQDNLTRYLEADAPVAITQDGRKVGVDIPVRRKRTETELAAFDDASAKWEAELDSAGITEEELASHFLPITSCDTL
jgi:hypothetical protein